MNNFLARIKALAHLCVLVLMLPVAIYKRFKFNRALDAYYREKIKRGKFEFHRPCRTNINQAPLAPPELSKFYKRYGKKSDT